MQVCALRHSQSILLPSPAACVLSQTVLFCDNSTLDPLIGKSANRCHPARPSDPRAAGVWQAGGRKSRDRRTNDCGPGAVEITGAKPKRQPDSALQRRVFEEREFERRDALIDQRTSLDEAPSGLISMASKILFATSPLHCFFSFD